MSDNLARGFLEDIIAHPDDDAPRLIFADWLDEQGSSARAEFIRSQIERIRLPDWDARQVWLWLREQELLAQHGRKWKEDLPSIKGMNWDGFRRGFVATAIFTSFAELRANAAACWAATPLEAITVRWPRRKEKVETLGPIAGLRHLSINMRVLEQREVVRLAASPLLSTLRTLTIDGGGLGVEGVRHLLASPHLGNLTALRLPNNDIGDGVISALLEARSLTALAELDLSNTARYGRYGEDPYIDSAAVAALAAWPGLARLRSLNLSGNDVGRDGLRALLRSPHAAGLKVLVFRANQVDGTVMDEFEAARPELQLDVLDLGETLLRDLGPAYLAKAPCLRTLKVLSLDRCEIGLSGARALAGAAFFGGLRRLNVNYNNFGPEGLLALLEKTPPALHTLQMVANDLGDPGVSYLAESAASDTLLEVDLGSNGLGEHAAHALATSKHLRDLLVLRLDDHWMSKSAVAALAGSPLGKRLASLEARHQDEIPF
jgi:uncharacterized protein (TIGR02996 family)